MRSDFVGAPSEVRVGRLSATCPSCGQSSLFLRAKGRRRRKADSLLCAGCGAEHFYTVLLEQVARRTIADAESTLERARARRKKI
jgi:transposase-like protein